MNDLRGAHNPLPPWVVPVLATAFAIPTFVAFWIGGRPELGLLWAGVQVALALVLVVGRRSETIRLLRGLDDDERARLLEYKATTAVGIVLVGALTVLFLAAGVRGENGVVYAALLLLAEATHLTALFVLNRKS